MSDPDPLEAQRQRITETERARRAQLAALEEQGATPAIPPTRRNQRLLDPIEAKRRRMAEALQRKQSRQVTRPRPQVVLLVKPNLRRIRQLQREAALAPPAAPPAPGDEIAPPAPEPALSVEDEISRRMREARERLREE